MDNIEIVKEWLFIGDKDIESAIFLKNMHPVPLEIICFHCQQCAEKYLKGFLAYKEEKIEKTHNLLELNEMCMNHGVDFKTIEEECVRLTEYGTDIRYPSYGDITMPHMELAIKDAAKIKEFVLKKIKIKV